MKRSNSSQVNMLEKYITRFVLQSSNMFRNKVETTKLAPPGRPTLPTNNPRPGGVRDLMKQPWHGYEFGPSRNAPWLMMRCWRKHPLYGCRSRYVLLEKRWFPCSYVRHRFQHILQVSFLLYRVNSTGKMFIIYFKNIFTTNLLTSKILIRW